MWTILLAPKYIYFILPIDWNILLSLYIHYIYIYIYCTRSVVSFAEYKVHAYNRNGLCAVGFMDDHYPVRSAFSLLNQVRVRALFRFNVVVVFIICSLCYVWSNLAVACYVFCSLICD
jgi:hypothetical protein